CSSNTKYDIEWYCDCSSQQGEFHCRQGIRMYQSLGINTYSLFESFYKNQNQRQNQTAQKEKQCNGNQGITYPGWLAGCITGLQFFSQCIAVGIQTHRAVLPVRRLAQACSKLIRNSRTNEISNITTAIVVAPA